MKGKFEYINQYPEGTRRLEDGRVLPPEKKIRSEPMPIVRGKDGRRDWRATMEMLGKEVLS